MGDPVGLERRPVQIAVRRHLVTGSRFLRNGYTAEKYEDTAKKLEFGGKADYWKALTVEANNAPALYAGRDGHRARDDYV